MPCNPQVIIKVAVTLMLLGANNIWADTGDVAATYRRTRSGISTRRLPRRLRR